MDRGERGFTLLEMLVVLFMIAMMASLAGLSIGKSDGGLRIESERLYGLVELASEEAVLRDRQMGLRIARQLGGRELVFYQWMIWDGRTWLPINDPPYDRHYLPEGLDLRLSLDALQIELPVQVDGESPAGTEPQLRFASTGELEQFRIDLAFGDSFPPRAIVAEGLTGLRLEVADAL